MNFRKLDPDLGYRRDHLWLPLSKIRNTNGIKNSLTFPQETKAPIFAYGKTSTHLVVPREYYSYRDWGNLPYEVVDVTPDNFPKVQVSPTFPLKDTIQETSFRALVEGNSGVLSLGCGRGKTVIALHAWAKLGMPLLVVTPTIDLAYQWRSRILEHTSVGEDEIGWVQGAKRDWEHPVTIATIHTMAQKYDEFPEEMRRHFGVVVFDEIHRLGAPDFQRCAPFGYGARIGLSATPFRKDGMDALYMYHTGGVLYEYLENDVLPEVFFKRTGVKIPEKEKAKLIRNGEMSLPLLLSWLGRHDDRNALIHNDVQDALDDGRVSLSLSERTGHVKSMHKHFPDSGIILGAVKGADRESALQDHQAVFAITQLARDGLDRKDLNTIFITMPFTDENRLRQIIGRSLRSKDPIVVIYEDEHIKPCRAMCHKLRKHLRALKYPFQTVDV
jgi:superfamily II DNA or RNA helicase